MRGALVPLVAVLVTLLGSASLPLGPRAPRAGVLAAQPKGLERAAAQARTPGALAGENASGQPGPASAVGCPPGTIPDGEICVRIPGEDEEGPASPASPNLHRERSGRWAHYDQIPRRPDRPGDYDLYRYPVPPLPGAHSVVSGYDLDRADESQRRGRKLRAVGHGGVDLPQAKGTPVKLVALEHQKGEAEVLHAGGLFGTTVVTLQTLREGGRMRDYVVLFGHLDGIVPGVGPGTLLRDGDVLGFVGDTGSPELVHLHYEVRRVRDGVDAKQVVRAQGAGRLVADDVTVVCDPRNVLPLR
jgi:murein DD-endopeptidase MepM/ murein hydrolase activator NlpD